MRLNSSNLAASMRLETSDGNRAQSLRVMTKANTQKSTFIFVNYAIMRSLISTFEGVMGMVILKILTYVFIGGLGSVGTFPVAFASAKSKADLITIYISEVPPFASVHPDSGQPQGYFPE